MQIDAVCTFGDLVALTLRQQSRKWTATGL